jgi:hypothetical protein
MMTLDTILIPKISCLSQHEVSSQSMEVDYQNDKHDVHSDDTDTPMFMATLAGTMHQSMQCPSAVTKGNQPVNDRLSAENDGASNKRGSGVTSIDIDPAHQNGNDKLTQIQSGLRSAGEIRMENMEMEIGFGNTTENVKSVSPGRSMETALQSNGKSVTEGNQEMIQSELIIPSFLKDRLQEYFPNEVVAVEMRQTNLSNVNHPISGNHTFPAREIFATYRNGPTANFDSPPILEGNRILMDDPWIEGVSGSEYRQVSQNLDNSFGRQSVIVDQTHPDDPQLSRELKHVNPQRTDTPIATKSTDALCIGISVSGTALDKSKSHPIRSVINENLQIAKETPRMGDKDFSQLADTDRNTQSVHSLDSKKDTSEAKSDDAFTRQNSNSTTPDIPVSNGKIDVGILKESTLGTQIDSYNTSVEFRQALIDRITHQLDLQIKNNITEMKITLQPESLGAISLKLKMQDGKLNAQIDVHNPEVRSALSVSIPQIQAELTQRGIEVQRINISSFGETFGNAPKQGQQLKQKSTSKQEITDDDSDPVPLTKSLGYNTMELVI